MILNLYSVKPMLEQNFPGEQVHSGCWRLRGREQGVQMALKLCEPAYEVQREMLVAK